MSVEPFSTTLAAVALIHPAVVGILEGYKILTNLGSFGGDVSEIYTRLLTEKVRLQNWYEYWKPELGSLRDRDSMINPCIDEATIDLVVLRLCEIGVFFSNDEVLKRHGLGIDFESAQMPSGKAINIGHRSEVPSSLWTRVASEKMSYKERVQALQEGVSFVKRLRWRVLHREPLNNFIRKLKEGNDSLYEILPGYLKLTVQRANVTALTSSDSVQCLFGLEKDCRAIAEVASAREKSLYEIVRAVASFKAAGLRLEEGGTVTQNPPWCLSVFPGMISYTSTCFVPVPARQPGSEVRAASRVFAYFNDKGPTEPVMIEWKPYKAQELTHRAGPAGEILTERVYNLAGLLYEKIEKPKGLRILSGQGCFDDVAGSRFGFVFKVPVGPDSQLPRVTTLYSILGCPFVPDLGHRFHLAQVLATGLFDLHMCGWLHKSIRSNNVIFFQNAESPVTQLPSLSEPEPYFVGFGYARRNSSSEHTKIEPTSSELRQSSSSSRRRRNDADPETKQMGYAWEHDLYRHPTVLSSWPTGPDRFQRKHDIFSLGIMLLEIGLWLPVEQMLRPAKGSPTPRCLDRGPDGQIVQSVEVVNYLLSTHVKALSYKCGGKYKHAVETCLRWQDDTGLFGGGKNVAADSDEPGDFQEEFDVARDKFNYGVVRGLAHCVA